MAGISIKLYISCSTLNASSFKLLIKKFSFNTFGLYVKSFSSITLFLFYTDILFLFYVFHYSKKQKMVDLHQSKLTVVDIHPSYVWNNVTCDWRDYCKNDSLYQKDHLCILSVLMEFSPSFLHLSIQSPASLQLFSDIDSEYFPMHNWWQGSLRTQWWCRMPSYLSCRHLWVSVMVCFFI